MFISVATVIGARSRNTHAQPSSAPAQDPADIPTKCRDFRDPFECPAGKSEKLWKFQKFQRKRFSCRFRKLWCRCDRTCRFLCVTNSLLTGKRKHALHSTGLWCEATLLKVFMGLLLI